MQDLKKLLQLLLEHEVDFVLVGGFACTTYGSSLVTQDLDICVAITEEQISKLRKALKDVHPIHRMNPNFQPTLFEYPKNIEGTKNIYLKTDLGVLDILSEITPIGSFERIKEKAQVVSLYGRRCQIISIDDLIQSKMAMTRPKDKEAVAQLEVIKKKMPQYDEIADAYSNSTLSRNDREAVLVPSANFYLGNLKEKKILDLACGDGFFSRYLRDWGAKQVVGVDISAALIEIARTKESSSPKGIEYLVDDVVRMKKLGEFDIVFAAFLLHYAPSTYDLRAMCKNICAQLKPRGQFVTFNENPFFTLHSGIKYDVETVPITPVADGSQVRLVHYKNGKIDFEFTRYHYEAQTYETALAEAGFHKIQWKPFVLSSSLCDKNSKLYWNDYLNDFSITVLTCEKK